MADDEDDDRSYEDESDGVDISTTEPVIQPTVRPVCIHCGRTAREMYRGDDGWFCVEEDCDNARGVTVKPDDQQNAGADGSRPFDHASGGRIDSERTTKLVETDNGAGVTSAGGESGLPHHSPTAAPSGCSCPAWRANIDKVNAPFVLQAARNPQTYRGYDGEPFHYCPWCGTGLP